MSIYNINTTSNNSVNYVKNSGTYINNPQPPNNTIVSRGNNFTMRIYTLYVQDRVEFRYNIPTIISSVTEFGSQQQQHILSFPPTFNRY